MSAKIISNAGLDLNIRLLERLPIASSILKKEMRRQINSLKPSHDKKYDKPRITLGHMRNQNEELNRFSGKRDLKIKTKQP